MTAEQFKLLERIVINPLKQMGCRVYIFGSRATGRNHPHSDVDLLYSGSSAFKPGFLSEIKEAIDESRFPFIVELVAEEDLVESYRPSMQASRIEL